MSAEVQQLERQLKDAKHLVEQKRLALKLADNREFRALILDEFCTKECARYAQSSADPALGANERADALAMAQAAGHLRRFLSVKIQMGSVAERDIEAVEEALVAARQEQGE
jgi:hypothetical protein